MRSRGERGLLFKIAKNELVEGVKEVLEIKRVDKKKRLYKIVVRVTDTDTEGGCGEYIVYALIQLTTRTTKDFNPWKLIDLSWEVKNEEGI